MGFPLFRLKQISKYKSAIKYMCIVYYVKKKHKGFIAAINEANVKDNEK